MLYDTAEYWIATDGLIWHSLSNSRNSADRDLGPVDSRGGKLQQRAYEKSLAWAQSHGMAIKDAVSKPTT